MFSILEIAVEFLSIVLWASLHSFRKNLSNISTGNKIYNFLKDVSILEKSNQSVTDVKKQRAINAIRKIKEFTQIDEFKKWHNALNIGSRNKEEYLDDKLLEFSIKIGEPRKNINNFDNEDLTIME